MMRRLDRGEIIRGISLKLQEEERERRCVHAAARFCAPRPRCLFTTSPGHACVLCVTGQWPVEMCIGGGRGRCDDACSIARLL